MIQRALASPPLPHFAFLFSSSSSKKKNHDASPAKRGQGPAPPVVPADRALLRGPDLGAQARGLEGEGLGERKRRKKQKHGVFSPRRPSIAPRFPPFLLPFLKALFAFLGPPCFLSEWRSTSSAIYQGEKGITEGVQRPSKRARESSLDETQIKNSISIPIKNKLSQLQNSNSRNAPTPPSAPSSAPSRGQGTTWTSRRWKSGGPS